jgi:hypothetical protein
MTDAQAARNILAAKSISYAFERACREGSLKLREIERMAFVHAAS